MELIKVKDYDEISKLVGERIISLIIGKPSAILGLATGSTPVGTYQYLIKAYREKRVSFMRVSTYNLDEYCGIEQNHPQSYYTFMYKNLFNHIDILKNKVHIPYATKYTQEYDCLCYSKTFEKASIDLQILGIGTNGHIGFNEPGTPFTKRTFIVNLTEKTREDNKRFFKDISEVPTQAITMGIAEIMKAKEIILIASGQNKADAIYQLIYGPVTTAFPASVLKQHPNVKIYVDEAAASKLERLDFNE